MIIIVFSLVLSQPSQVRSSIERDYWPTNGWLTSSLREANMNQSRIEDMFEYIESNSFDMDSVLVVKNGNLTVEEYLNEDYTASELHSVFSITKSVSSALIGIAIEEGYIESVNQKILDFFQDVNVLNKANKENITIEHLLTHTSGVYWREDQLPYSSPDNSFGLMTDSPNWVEFYLNLSIENEPGTVRNYNSGDSHMLSAILSNATGTSTYLFAKEHLFDPLGIKDLYWQQDPQGTVFGGSGLRLTPRSLAKFGYLYLNNGTWDQEQLIPEEWVLNSTKIHISWDDWASYGYQWYIYPQAKSYIALGYQQQIIWVTPEYDLVIVLTSTITEGMWPFVILAVDYIIKSIEEGYVDKTSLPLITIIPVLILIGSKLRSRKRIRNRIP
jgi:CubicO group peptidase (beta-lactamase class C family)